MHIHWKRIIGYPDYEVSDTGLVRTIDGDVLKQQVYNNYLSVRLNNKWEKVHRLVAIHFIPNPDNKPVVNHNDFNTYNNHSYNLQWMTHQENVNHSKKRMNYNKYKVNRLHPETKEVIETYPSCQAAVIAMGGKNNGSAVARAIKQGTKSFGYYWERATTIPKGSTLK